MSQIDESTKSRSSKAKAAQQVKNRLRDIREPGGQPGGDGSNPIGHGTNAFYVGIDLGTSRTTISTSNGARHTLR